VSASAEQKPEDMRKYLDREKVMIVDPGATSRATMFKAFTELGALPGNVNLVDSYQNALAESSFSKTRIIVAEYDLGKRSGLELLQEMRVKFAKEKGKFVFLIVTSNTSQTAVAQAAEEDVDAYILKPFTAEVVRKTLARAIESKLKPSPYILMIEEGKLCLDKMEFDKALERFEKATKLDDTPTLAYYYSGHAKALKQAVAEAKTDFQRGLAYNNVHFKCMAGLFDLLMQERDFAQAYDVVRRMARFFPANPRRLVDVLKLAVINRKFDDIEEYYNMFVAIDDRDDILIRHVVTSLIICGKHYLENDAKARALELFQKASATGTGRVNFLKEIVQILLDHKLPAEAQGFLKKFPPEAMTTDAFKILQFQIMDHTDATKIAVISRGRELIEAKIHDKAIYAIVLKRGVEIDMKVMVEHLYYQAIRQFPECKEEFKAIVLPLVPEVAS
jgi:CheY-like chemotaxis protein